MADLPDATAIRLLALDVDGVLTDNAVYIGEVGGSRVEFKRFDIHDGLGHALLRGTAIDVVWISGRESTATTLRGAELGVGEVCQVAPGAKMATLAGILEARGLGWHEVAFVGDDFADFTVMERVGLPIAVANARQELKAIAAYVTEARGGHGAVREVIDLLLKSRGEWAAAIARIGGPGAPAPEGTR